MRCGCGFRHSHIQHVCDQKEPKDKPAASLSRMERGMCGACPSDYIPCQTCWVKAGYMAHKWASTFRKGPCGHWVDVTANQARCPECGHCGMCGK